MNLRDVIPTAENSSNFNVVPESITEVGTTLENLKAAVCGETGASAKYAACCCRQGAGLRPDRPPVRGHQRRRADSHRPGRPA